jgi:hypothetical protein
MNKIINLTPHDVDIYKDGKIVKTYKSKGSLRLKETLTPEGKICGVPIVKSEYCKDRIPKYQKGVYYIVSNVVQFAYPKRKDLLVTLDLVRDEHGNIIGCKSLGYAAYKENVEVKKEV